MSEAICKGSMELIDAGAARQIRRAIERGRNPDDLWNRIGERLDESIQYNFEQGGRPQRWPALSMATLMHMRGPALKRKSQGRFDFGLRTGAAKRIARHQILVGKGRLAKSIAYRYSDTEFQIGSNLIYARIHQFGGQAGRKSARVTLPQRAYLVIQDDDKRGIVEVDIPAFLEVK